MPMRAYTSALRMFDVAIVLILVGVVSTVAVYIAMRGLRSMRTRSSRTGRELVTQPDGLIQVLLDKSAEYGDRDDAALDLWYFDDLRAERALAQVVADPTEDEDLADTCLDTLRQIWTRRGGAAPDLRNHLLAAALPPKVREQIESTPSRVEAPPN
jgi:hypothetical protein